MKFPEDPSLVSRFLVYLYTDDYPEDGQNLSAAGPFQKLRMRIKGDLESLIWICSS